MAQKGKGCLELFRWGNLPNTEGRGEGQEMTKKLCESMSDWGPQTSNT